jgi:hypothetical protein
VEAASLDGDQYVKASRIEAVTLRSDTDDPARLPDIVSKFTLRVRVPRNTQNVRVAMENQENGRIGAAELSRKVIAAAPAAPTTEPKIVRRPDYVRPETN